MLKSYLKIALKVLLRRKFFTFVSLFGITFTLVVVLLLAAFVDSAFGARAPETKLDRALGIFNVRLQGEEWTRTSSAGYRLLDETFRDLPGAEQTAIFNLAAEQFAYRNGEKLPVYFKRADDGYWRVFDYTFLEGAPYTAEDERAGAPVAVLNASTSRRFFGAEPAVGKSFSLNGRQYRVVGVVADVPIVRALAFSDVWVPIASEPNDAYRKNIVGEFIGLAVARTPADLPALRAEMTSRIAGIDLSTEDDATVLTARAETVFESLVRNFTGDDGGPDSVAVISLLVLLLGFLVLLLPAVNLVNLNLSRILERASEIGIRKAFGASSRTLVAQFVVENVVLTAIGGAVAFALGFAILQALNASSFFPYADFRLSYRVLLAGIAVTLFFGVLSGVYPAWRMSRLNPVAALHGRSS